jgi:PAS domain S-box-containing protein
LTDAGNPRRAVAEEKFRLLVDSVRDYAIFLLDPSGHVATWNTGARVIKGYTADEIVGKHISVFYTPDERDKPGTLLQMAVRDGRVEDEGWRVRKDGTRFWADVVITALRESTGELVGFAKVTRDLTERRESEERLRQAEERLATTLYSIGDGVLATDEAGRVTVINRVAQDLTGWTLEEAIGRPVHEVFNIVNEYTRTVAANPVSRVLAEGKVVGLANHTALIARDGSECPIADSGAPIRDARGVTRGAVLVFRDVTEERRAEEALRQSEARLRLMIESVRDYAIYMLDPDGRVASWNTGAQTLKGYTADEIVGEHFSRFFTPEDIASSKPVRELEIAAEQGRFEDEAWRVRKDGGRFWANVVISAVRDASGRLIGFAKVTRDLTERRHTEEERVRFAQAQEAVRLRDEFLSIASHELKTPLTALQLQLQGILDRAEGLDERVATKVGKAIRAGARLGDLIESLLDVSRIATGAITLDEETFDLVEATRDVVERLRETATRARCDVTVVADRPVMGRSDRLRFEQLVTNLLSNAFKYAPGGPVSISIARPDDHAVIEVRDSGPGLHEGDFQRVFDRFERGSPTSYGGLGLGLYLARQIAEAHGGTITATNLPSGGARFVVRLPHAP